MASQKQWECTQITGKGDPNSQVPAPHLQWWLKEDNVLTDQPLHPIKHVLQIFTDASKEGWGTHLNKPTARGTWSLPKKMQAANKLSRTQRSFSSLKRIIGPLYRQDSSYSNRQHHSGVIHKQGRRHEVGPTLCLTMEYLDLVYQEISASKSLTHSRPAEHGSRQAIQARPDHPEWSLLPEVFKSICSRWHRSKIDLLAMRPWFVSPVPDPLAAAVDAFSLPWEDLDVYALPPAAILGKVVEKLQDIPRKRIILIALGWPNMPWFWDLVAMSIQIPLSLPNMSTQPFNQIPHRNLTSLNLHAWLLEPQQSRSRASLRQWQQELRLLKEDQPDQSMRQGGHFYKVVHH